MAAFHLIIYGRFWVITEDFPVLFAFAHLLRCAAATRARPSALMVRLVLRPVSTAPAKSRPTCSSRAISASSSAKTCLVSMPAIIRKVLGVGDLEPPHSDLGRRGSCAGQDPLREIPANRSIRRGRKRRCAQLHILIEHHRLEFPHCSRLG
jgi:hypothetical protein